MRSSFGIILLVLVGFGAGHGEAVGTALDLATRAFDSQRDAKEKARSEIVLPAAETARLPEGAEAYLIRGYISYDFTRIFRRNGKSIAQTVRMTRSWFYSAGESYESSEYEIPEAEFRRAWEAAGLIVRAKQTVKPNDSRSITGSLGSSDHERTLFVKLAAPKGEAVIFQEAIRGQAKTDDVQKLVDLQTRALSEVLGALVPKKAGQPFAIKEWGPFLVDLLVANEPQLRHAPERLSDDCELVMETSLRLIGQIGDPAALEVIKKVDADAGAAPPNWHDGNNLSWGEDMAREARLAALKIDLCNHFDGRRAAQVLHDTSHRWNADADFSRWLRDLYFERDPEGYLALLSADAGDPRSDEELLPGTVEDLQKRYPKRAGPVLAGLLDHASPEVAAAAALALVALDPPNQAAWETLTKLASNPRTPIPPDARWFRKFGRSRALDALTRERSAVPSKYRWDATRVRQQLDAPWEDGRMVHELISAWSILQNEDMKDAEQIPAYRRSLAGPLNWGAVDAAEELIKRNDRDSAKVIEGLLDQLEKGCSRWVGGATDPQAAYPWIDKYDVEDVRKKLAKWDR